MPFEEGRPTPPSPAEEIRSSDAAPQTSPRLSRLSARHRLIIALSSILVLIVIDQVIKVYVKLHMALGESIKLAEGCFIYFTENPGMAFGWEFFDKVFLTVFRIIASIVILWLVVRTARRREFSTGFLICLSAVCAGAIGNIIDSVFYGQLFTHSSGQVATWAEPGMGYAGWMHGRVVDMFYFPIIHTTWPAWMPIVGGKELVFFRPIFNFADACISVGVICLLLFYAHSFTRLLTFGAPKPADQRSKQREDLA